MHSARNRVDLASTSRAAALCGNRRRNGPPSHYAVIVGKTALPLKIETNITFDPVKGFGHLRCPFGVIFEGNAMVRSMYKSADMIKKTLCNFGTTGQIVTYEGSFLGSFSCPIHW